MAAESVDVRLARLEGSYAQVSERLSGIEQRLGRLEDKIDRQFSWVVGLIVISILIPIALRFLPTP